MPFTRDDLWNATPEFLDRLLQAEDLRYLIMGVPSSDIVWDGAKVTWTTVKTLDLHPQKLNSPVMECKAIWSDVLHDASVRGMSGGPAYAIVDGRLYWCGIQSTEFGIPGRKPRHVNVALATAVFKVMELAAQGVGEDRP